MPKRTPATEEKKLGQRIREARRARALTMVELAEALDVSQPAISQWESGLAPPGRDSLTRLAKFLKLPLSRLLGEGEATLGKVAAQVAAMPADVPVQGVAVGGANGDFRFNGQIVDYVRRPPGVANARNVYALWIMGESMSPWNKNGDLIYVTPSRPPAIGDHVVIQLADGADGDPGVAMVKLLVAKTPTQLKLAQYNPQKEFALALAKVKSIHKVLSLNDLLGI